ncbi:MAG: SUMF1/EgtB/PvdO family nonheme iron enzyme [Burkholderiales bacterium]|nr:SUMF1/EgtB/PvdO family nonheme iron enzyme [Burkholderiales bacterium]
MLNGIDALADALRESREYTLSMYAHLEGAQWRFPLLEIVNPPDWELAHVGYFQEFFCLRWRPDDPAGSRRPSRLANADSLFDSRTVPHDDRWNLAYPPLGTIQAYLRETLERTLEDLAASREDDRHRFRLALFHEDMHGEALLMTLHTLGLAPPRRAHIAPPPAPSGPVRDVRFAGGEFLQGARRDDGEHAFDNEKWAHPVRVEPFAMASRPVSNGEFLAFVEEGGYARDEFWSAEGRDWREATGATAPRNWMRDGEGWSMRWFDSRAPLRPEEPVVQVCRHEAEAWCRWAGRRLPTESEWEFAARNGGRDDRYPWGGALPSEAQALDYRLERPAMAPDPVAGASGLEMMIGGVWEWTATSFAPYPGFEKDAYAEYSEPWFHSHGTLRGGCFATRSRLVHNRWRNFYLPHRNDVFAGLRSCALAGESM